MTLDALIQELQELRLQIGGEVPVVIGGGMDPSDLSRVSRVEVSTEQSFCPTEGAFLTQQSIKIT